MVRLINENILLQEKKNLVIYFVIIQESINYINYHVPSPIKLKRNQLTLSIDH